MRLLGCSKVASGGKFNALNVAGVENTIADSIARWKSEAISVNLGTFFPGDDS